ncbi:MAG: hypothetical protein NZ992_05575 [Candidatus Korarchaeum sp.]|nr:hypothetical protein [Candidatus Korarchaeum sp.]
MRFRYFLMVILLLSFLLVSVASSQSNWDLGIDRVNVVSTTVKQGEPLKIAVYVRNNEGKPFSGVINVTMLLDDSKVPALMEFICVGEGAKCPPPTAPGLGVKDLPARGYVSLVFNLDTSKMEAGAHKLTVEVRPRGYIDPNPADNKKTLSFTVESVTSSYSTLMPIIAILALLLLIAILMVRRRSRK